MMDITLEEAAAALDGCEYRGEGSPEIWARFKAAGLVALYGASDDLAEVNGAIYDECGAYEGKPIYLTRAGLVEDGECEACNERAKAVAAKIRVASYASWAYATDLPHAEFRVMEDGEVYGVGIIFRLADLPPHPDETAALRAVTRTEGQSMSKAARDVLAERRRQIEREGKTLAHDDTHVLGEMSLAAALYALPYEIRIGDERLIRQEHCISLDMVLNLTLDWSNKPEPDDRRRKVKAAALLLAEIERMDRAEARAGGGS